jgi:hypothetical protein
LAASSRTGHSVAVGDTLAEDRVRVQIGGERPASEGQDPLKVGQVRELLELFLVPGQIDIKGGGYLSEGKVYMRVGRRQLASIHDKARAIHSERFEVADVQELTSNRAAVDNFRATIRYAAVLAGCGCPRSSGRGLGDSTEFGRDTTLSPDVALSMLVRQSGQGKRRKN